MQKSIIKYLQSKGYSVFKTIATNRRGIADIIACSPLGVFTAIEVKLQYNKPSPLQLHYIEEVKACNGVAFVAYSLDDVKNTIDIKV